MTYEQWEAEVPSVIRDDVVWGLEAYRLGLFLSDLAWHDLAKIREAKLYALADQLYRSAGNIDSSVGEGYARSSRKDRARFYEYALGSARECRGWYYKARHCVGVEVAEHRMAVASSIIRLLLTMLTNLHRTHSSGDE